MIGEQFKSFDQIRKHIILFAVAFRNVMIQRNNGKVIRVPISFGNKERFFVKLNSELYEADPRENKRANIETVLPRMSFNITNMQYRPSIKTPSTNYKTFEQPDGKVTAQFVPTPWDISFELSVYTRYEEDMLKVFEQIVPFFQPHITMEMETEIDYPNIKNRDVHLVLDGVSPEEDIYGSMEDRRTLVWNFAFKMGPVYIYPPSIDNVGKIKSIKLDFVTGVETVSGDEIDVVDLEVLKE